MTTLIKTEDIMVSEKHLKKTLEFKCERRAEWENHRPDSKISKYSVLN